MAGRPNQKGRSSGTARHIRIYQSMMKTSAWRSLSPQERAVFLELNALYNGSNNGELFLSCRQAADRCNISRNTAQKCFEILQEKGFIRRRSNAPEAWDEKLARCWILTEHIFAGHAATRDYVAWRPDEKTERVAPIWDKVSQNRATSSDEDPKIVPLTPKSGSHLGQKNRMTGSHLGHR